MRNPFQRTNPATAAEQQQSEAAATLRAQRDDLAAKVAEATWDLGGLTYEMAIRDHFRLDVLVRRSAALQELDAELGEVERLLLMEETATTGSCRSCGAVHSRGAAYCWKCGQPLMLETHVTTPAGPTAPPMSELGPQPAPGVQTGDPLIDPADQTPPGGVPGTPQGQGDPADALPPSGAADRTAMGPDFYGGRD